MKIIVPLAGPDFELADGRVKAEIDLDGQPLLRRALESRPWWTNGEASDADLVFVLKCSARTQAFADGLLREWYPRARVVMISDHACGAALSAQAGLALVAHVEEPAIVDLADILYDCDLSIVETFASGASIDAVALVFPSDRPEYSYLSVDEKGEFIEAAEKRVISNSASAGTYIYRSPAWMLRAIAHSLDNRDAVRFRNLFYVCPLYNGIRASGGRVTLVNVTGVRDIKIA